MTNVSRRSFISGAAVAGLAAAAGVATGCSSSTNSEQQTNNDVLDYSAHDKKWTFEIAPEAISDDQITETFSAEVIVIGSGPSGLVTAVSAKEQGADVIVVSASSNPIGRGGSNFALRTKAQNDQGIELTDDVIRNIVKSQQVQGSYYVDTKKWADLVNNSKESMDWLIDKCASKKLKVSIEPAFVDPDNGILSMPALAHNFFTDEKPLGFMDGAPMQAQAMADVFTDDLGGTIYYDMPVRQLIRGGEANGTSGVVGGCIAQNADGSYTKFEASKAVVLATGDFTRDKDMMAKYAPWAYENFKDEITWDVEDYNVEANWSGLYHGDGHKMALWVGAAWQKTFPCPPMACDGVGGPIRAAMANFWGLNINTNGKRFINELTSWPYAGVNIMRQPNKTAFGIWDKSYAYSQDIWEYFGCTVGNVNGCIPYTPEQFIESWEANIEKGKYFKADTIEELLDILMENGLDDKEAALATIEEYNRFAKQGLDEEFQKNPVELFPISTGPFYASISIASKIRTICGGIRTNSDMQALDATDTPVEGLYTTGIMIGDFYSNLYNFYTPGVNLGGVCGTLSYLLGHRLAAL